MRLRTRKLIRYLAFACVLLFLTMVYQRLILPDDENSLPGDPRADTGDKLPRERAISRAKEPGKDSISKVHVCL